MCTALAQTKKMRRFDLVALDLDGTLLNSQKQISPINVQAIQAACKLGVKVVLATARPPRSTSAFYNILGLDTLTINYNGALINDPQTNGNTAHWPLDAALAKEIARHARKVDPDVVISLEVLDRWLTDRVDQSLLTETARDHGPDVVGPLESLFDAPITKMMLLAPPKQLTVLHQMVKQRFARQVNIAISDDFLIQLLHPKIDKAFALWHVAKKYHVPADRVLAMGDAPNDNSMLQWAGLGVAVSNAWEQTKQVADKVVSSNDQNAVAQVIEKYVL